MIDVAYLQRLNVERAKRWHKNGIADWSALEWAGAMCGEAGEAANIAKKIKRIDDRIQNREGMKKIKGKRQLAEYRRKLGKEVADTIMYAVLLAAREGIDIEEYLKFVFNKKSIEYGFPERL